MTSFSIPDATTTVELDKHDSQSENVRTGTISFTVRNTSEEAKTARLEIEGDQKATPGEEPDLEWFTIEGAADTNRQFFESDFAAETSQTISVAIKAIGKDDERSYKFRLRATAEDNPDNDFVVGPWVTVAVPPFKEEEVITPPRKWWKIAIGVGLVLLVSVLVWQWLFGGQLGEVHVRGLDKAAAKRELVSKGYPAGPIEFKQAANAGGEEPGMALRHMVANKGQTQIILIDPGVDIPTTLRKKPVDEAAQRLQKLGLVPLLNPTSVESPTAPGWVTVTSIRPPSGTVASGTNIIVNYQVKPFQRPNGAGHTIDAANSPQTMASENIISIALTPDQKRSKKLQELLQTNPRIRYVSDQ